MLTNAEWAVRLGIVPASMPPAAEARPKQRQPQWQESDNPVVMMVGLSIFRFMPEADQSLYTSNLQKLCSPYAKAGSAFWSLLREKKKGLFGEGLTPGNLDPIALYRHPWSLSTEEFALAYERVQSKHLPTSVPDTRTRVSSLLGQLSTGFAVIAAATTPLPPLSVAAGALSTATGLSQGASALLETQLDKSEQRKFQSQIVAFGPIFEREADYRRREVVGSLFV